MRYWIFNFCLLLTQEQNPTMGNPGNPLDEDEEDDGEVDTTALIPTADVVNSLSEQMQGSDRQHICGVSASLSSIPLYGQVRCQT